VQIVFLSHMPNVLVFHMILSEINKQNSSLEFYPWMNYKIV